MLRRFVRQESVTRYARVSGACLAAAVVGLLATAPARAGSYTFRNVVNPADVTFNQLLGINNSGTISGYFGIGSASHPNQGYTVSPPGYTSFTNENYPASVQTQVVAINSIGNTAGFYIDSGGNQHGFTDMGGTFRTVDDPLGAVAGGGGTQLLSLNDHGQASGFYVDASGNMQGFTVTLGTNPTFSPLSFLPAGTIMSQAGGINNLGMVSGFYENLGVNAGFLYDPTSHTLSTLMVPGSTLTEAFGLNNNGQVVGIYDDAMGVQHGFVWQGGNFTTIDAPGSAPGTTTLNGINDQGQLVGFFVDANDNTIGLLGTPTAVPEPGSLVLLGIGCVMAAGLLRVRSRKG